jgi:hypothetical protein
MKLCRVVSEDEALHDHDCLVLVLMSHGRTEQDQSQLQAADGSYVNIKELITPFDNEHCMGLRGKPKIVFVQSCRGGKLGLQAIVTI